MSKKFLTLDDLLLFCKNNNFNHFNANEAGGPIIVQTPGKFELSGESNTGLLPVKLYACHTNLNRNGSSISKDAMEAALPSFSNRPILGYIHQLEDGTWDFYSHNVDIVEDENEEDGTRVEYLESPVGIVPENCNAHLEYDEENKVYRTCVNGLIFEEYTKAADIIRAKGISSVSVEIAINDMSYNAKEGYLSINDFYFMGVTVLGRDNEGNIVEPGMAGSNITLGSFSAENNSVLNDNVQQEMIETLKKLTDVLDKFNNTTKDSNEKVVNGEMDKLNELLEAYELILEDLKFSTDGLSDEDLEAAFTEHFGTAEEFKSQTSTSTDENSEDGDPAPTDDGDKYALNYELSHDDIRCGLYNLLNSSMDEDSYAWICEVFDNHFIYEKDTWTDSGYSSGYYKQSYSMDGDNIAFDNDPVEVFPEFVTSDEKAALAALRLEYAELKAFKENIEKQELQAKKDAILNDEKYSTLKDNEKFEQLKKDAEKFSVEEVETKAKLIFADAVIEAGNYSASGEHAEKKLGKIGFNFSEKPKSARAYAGLFDE